MDAVGRRSVLAALLATLLVALPGGCGYNFRAPYEHEIHTIYVPVFRSIDFRRDVNLQLTELVIKEIERRTPWKVVGTQDGADMILNGTVNYATKNIVVENPFNMPRQLSAQINVSVAFVHNPPTPEEIEKGMTQVTENINFVPEIGETSETAFYRTNQALAKQIVDMMENPW
jgi:hypothetical protein